MVEMGQPATALDCRNEADAMRMARSFSARTRSKAAPAADRRAILTRTVELDVIPQLLLARRAGVTRPELPPEHVTKAHVSQLATITLSTQEPETCSFVQQLQEQGVRPEALYLDLLAPTARRLGEMWADDLCDFTEVTVGLWRLQNAMRVLGPAFMGSAFRPLDGNRNSPRVLLAPLPGEQHTFGLAMVFDFFRRAGWNAWSGTIANRGELATMVRSEWFDVIGFSMASDERLETARAEIRAVRLASRNPGVAVMVGGPPFVIDARLAAAIGADGTAQDGLQAVGAARALLRRDAERR